MTDTNKITYTNVQHRINAILKSNVLETDDMRSLYKDIELYLAHKLIAGEEDRPMKDVEFFMRSAIFLIDVGKPRDCKLQLEAEIACKLQLEAAIAVLATTHSCS